MGRRTNQPRTAEGKENQLINLAMKLAEKKLLDGTASSQIITHFLNLATAKVQLEAEKLRADVALSGAKIEKLKSDSDIKELYESAIAAMKSYQGANEMEDDEYDEGY